MVTAIYIVELLGLFILSRWVTRALFEVAYRLTMTRSVSISIVTLLLFPGTVIHELAHLFTAEVLGVHTGKLILVPEIIRGEEVKTGSVAIAKTDPFRRALIGIAPFLTGIGAVFAITQVFSFYFQPSSPASLADRHSTILTISYYYLLFAISNTMFPSPSDMKGVWPVAMVIVLLISAAGIAGINLSLSGHALTIATSLLTLLTEHLKIVLAINGVLLLVLEVFLVFIRKI